MFPIDDMRMTPNQRVMIGNFKHDSGLFGTLLSRIDVLAAVHIPNMSKKVEMFTQNDCKEAKLEIQKDFSYKNSPHWFWEAHWFDGVVTSGPPLLGRLPRLQLVPIESTGGSYHRPLLDISTAT